MPGKRVIVALLLALTVVGCGPTAPSTKQLASIKIVPDVSLLKVGTVTQFSSVETWVGDGGPPPGPAPAWSMSDDSIAKVDFSGTRDGRHTWHHELDGQEIQSIR